MTEPNGSASLHRAAAAARTTFTAALNAKRLEEAAALYAEDARLLAPSADVIEGRVAIEAYWRFGLEAGVADIRLEPDQLQGRDGAAYEIGRYSLRLVPTEGRPVVDRGTYLLVHRPQPDGTWCWAIHTFNPADPRASRLPATDGGATGRRKR